MSVVDYTRVELKGVEKQLKRIADAFDIILMESYGFKTEELLSRRQAKGGEEESLEYTTDESSAVQEVKQAIDEIEKGKQED